VRDRTNGISYTVKISIVIRIEDLSAHLFDRVSRIYQI